MSIIGILTALLAGFITAFLTLPFLGLFIYVAYLGYTIGPRKEDDVTPFVPLESQKSLYQMLEEDALIVKKEAKVSGEMILQLGGQERNRHSGFAVLAGSTLFFQRRTTGKLYTMVVYGASIRKTRLGKENATWAIRVVHPDRKITQNAHYVFFILNEEREQRLWYYALIDSAKSINIPEKYPKENQILVNHLANLKQVFGTHHEYTESPVWITAFLLRSFLHISESKMLKQKIANIIADKFAEKVEQRGLGTVLSDIVITKVDFGRSPPGIGQLTLMNSEKEYPSVSVMFDFYYKNGSACIAFKATIYLGFTVQANITVILRELEGKVVLCFPPFPAKRAYLNFLHEPHSKMEVHINLGSYNDIIPEKIKETIVGKFRTSIYEKLVAPNRLYFMIPTAEGEDFIVKKYLPKLKVDVDFSNEEPTKRDQ